MAGTDRKRILVIDDDEHVLITLQALLENQGYDTTTAWSGQEALESLLLKPFDLVLVDDYLPDLLIGEILRQIRRVEIPPPVIVMQATPPTRGAIARYNSLGASNLINKRKPAEILEAVVECMSPAILS